MQTLKRVNARSLTGSATEHVAKGSCLRTDGSSGYRSVTRAGYDHRAVITGGGDAAAQMFPGVHTFIGNMKRVILGTYHSVSPKHLDRYLAALTHRANRRWMEPKLFDRLVIAAVDAKPLAFKDLTIGAKWSQVGGSAPPINPRGCELGMAGGTHPTIDTDRSCERPLRSLRYRSPH